MISILAMPITRLERCLRYRKQFVTIDDTQQYKRLRIQLHGQGIVPRDAVEGIVIKTKQQQIVQTGDLIVAEIDAKLGGIGIVPQVLEGGIVSSHYFIYEIDESLLLRSYLEYFIRAGGLEAQVKAQGSTNYAAIRPQQVLGFEIPLPPLEEQRRIVARIDELVGKIEEARRLRREAASKSSALMAAASTLFFGESDHKAPLKKLHALSTRITKGESPEWQGFTYQETGPLFIRSENVLWGALDLSKRTHIPGAFHQKLARSQLHPGDVLINLVGASIGRACVVPTDIEEANVNQAVAVISPDPEQLDSNYLMRFLISTSAQETIHGGKVETARPNISLGDLRELVLPTPTVAEQRRVVRYLSKMQAQVDALKHLQTETAAKLDALLPSILDKAFRGEL